MKEIIKKILKALPNAIKKFLYNDIKEMNEKTNQKLDDLTENYLSFQKDIFREKILSFASSLRRGEAHTTQEFQTICAFHDKYENLISRLGEKNGFTHSEFEYIEEKMREKMEECLK